MVQCLKTMAQLLLRHERCLNVQRSTDCFVLFFRQEPTGALKNLVDETQKWHQLKLAEPQKSMPPLRQHLMQTMLTTLMNWVSRVAKATPEEELFKACRTQNLILEDKSWPFLKWDHSKKSLVVDQTKPISMEAMLKKLNDLIEMFRVPSLVLRFYGMSSNSQQEIIPWKLQLNPRADEPYELLLTLAYSSIWTLVGTSLKPHSPNNSGLANQLQQMLQPKGAGKGRGKSKSGTVPKTES